MTTAAEKRLLNRTAELGCIICNGPAQIHHLRQGMGMGQRSKKFIPLCVLHHTSGGHGVAFHAGKRTWQETYGTELELWELVQKRLGD